MEQIEVMQKFSEQERKTTHIRNWDYMALFILVFGFILALIGFWQLESILWNRIEYTTGSLWANSDPIYRDTQLSEIVLLLDTNLIYYVVGCIMIGIANFLLFFQYLLKRRVFATSRRLSMVITILNLIEIISGFWIIHSLKVIGELPAFSGTVSGYQWLRVDIASFTYILSNFAFVFWILFSIFTLLSIIGHIILRRKLRIEKNQEESSSKETTYEEKRISYVRAVLKIANNILKNIPFYIVLILYLIFTLFPVYLAARASISTYFEILAGQNPNPNNILDSLVLNYSSVMFAVSIDEASFQSALFNSLFLGFGTSIVGLAISLTSAYGLARFDFKGKTILSFLILSTQMFPAIILLIPQFVIISDLNLLEESVVLIGVLIVMSTTSTAYVTWMMKGYFETIPRDIEEAAYIDGYGKLKTFIKIVLPLAKSGMVAVMVFTFLSAWQEFVLANTFIRSPSRFTLPLLFYNYQDLNQPNSPTFYELLSPYSILVAAPVVVFYLVLQKQLVSGVIAGSVK